MQAIFKNEEWEVYQWAESGSGKAATLFDTAVACGFASPAQDYVHDPIDMNDLLIDNPDATFIVKSIGNSMTGAGIHPGDYLVIDRGREYFPGCIALCCVNSDFTVKYAYAEQGILRSANKRFKDIVLSEGDTLHIWGLVTYCLKKMNI